MNSKELKDERIKEWTLFYKKNCQKGFDTIKKVLIIAIIFLFAFILTNTILHILNYQYELAVLAPLIVFYCLIAIFIAIIIFLFKTMKSLEKMLKNMIWDYPDHDSFVVDIKNNCPWKFKDEYYLKYFEKYKSQSNQ